MNYQDEEIYHMEELAKFQMECYRDYLEQSRRSALKASEAFWFVSRIYHNHMSRYYRECAIAHWDEYVKVTGKLDNIPPMEVNSYGNLLSKR